MTLRAYNCWTQERYENHELALEPYGNGFARWANAPAAPPQNDTKSKKTMKTMMKALLSLTLLLAVAPCALPVRAEEVLPPLSDLFLYEADAGEENAEASRAANAAYREKIDALAQPSDVVCEKRNAAV